MRQHLKATCLAAGLVLATACARPPAAPPAVSASGTQQLTVRVGNSMRFEPSRIVVRAGPPVEVTLRNEGVIPHDFTLAEGVAHAVTIVAQGGQTARATFTIERPGAYTFICSVPGHAAAGMQGTLTVQ